MYIRKEKIRLKKRKFLFFIGILILIYFAQDYALVGAEVQITMKEVSGKNIADREAKNWSSEAKLIQISILTLSD